MLQAPHQFERAHAGGRFVEVERDFRHLAFVQQMQPGMRQASKTVHQLLHEAAPADALRGVILLDEQAQRREQADDLFFADLAATADAVLRQALEPGLVDKMRRRRPQLVEHVEIEVLQGGGHHEVAPAAQDAGGLRPADRLAAGEGHQVRAGLDEPPQVARRRQLRRGVDQNRHAGGMSDLHHLLEPRPGVRAGHPVHGGGAFGQRIGDFPRLGVARARPGIAIGQADLDQPDPRRRGSGGRRSCADCAR